MGLFYTVNDKELLNLRNKIFVEKCIPILYLNGFERAPFTTAWFGRNNIGGFSYYFCRLSEQSILQNIYVHISKGDKWIKLYLNIFELHPLVERMEQLQATGGLQYFLPPNNISEMRLPDYNIPPILQYRFWLNQHKVGWYFTKNGLVTEIDKLSEIINKDIITLDRQIARWNNKFKVNLVDWEGNRVA